MALPQKYFLALDYASPNDAYRAATTAMRFLRETFPKAFDENSLGVKLNQHQVTGRVDPRLMAMPNIFADIKINHGSDTGKLILEALDLELPDMAYLTVSASLGVKILREYVEMCRSMGRKREGVGVVAFTAHTKMPGEDVLKVFGAQNVGEAILRLGEVAVDAGCDAMVLEAAMLKNPEIAALKIRKLVTGIRIDAADKGAQSRVTTVAELSEVLPQVDYVVVSHRYLEDPESMRTYFTRLLRPQ